MFLYPFLYIIMEDTINIAGVNCKVSRLGAYTYEDLYKLAINNIKWVGIKNRAFYIDKDLKDHGFKPIRQVSGKAKANNTRKGKKRTTRRNKG